MFFDISGGFFDVLLMIGMLLLICKIVYSSDRKRSERKQKEYREREAKERRERLLHFDEEFEEIQAKNRRDSWKRQKNKKANQYSSSRERPSRLT